MKRKSTMMVLHSGCNYTFCVFLELFTVNQVDISFYPMGKTYFQSTDGIDIPRGIAFVHLPYVINPPINALVAGFCCCAYSCVRVSGSRGFYALFGRHSHFVRVRSVQLRDQLLCGQGRHPLCFRSMRLLSTFSQSSTGCGVSAL